VEERHEIVGRREIALHEAGGCEGAARSIERDG
jgi:hypothetical protein